MSTNDWILLATALFPAVTLCIYIFKKDHVEKEPIGLLALLLISGVVICLPVVFTEEFLLNAIHSLFSKSASVEGGNYYLPTKAYHAYEMTRNVIGIALVEEGFKFLAMYVLTRKNKNFNYLFDGIVYAVFVSLGFAGFENILYSFEHGMGTALLRMVTAVPAHTFFAILMGYYYSQWHIYKLAAKKEKQLIDEGVIASDTDTILPRKYVVLALVVPTLVHGFYDYCCSISKVWATLLFVGLMIFLYIYCFRKVKMMSDYDVPDITAADAVLFSRYNGLQEYYHEQREQQYAQEDENNLDELSFYE